MRTRGPDYGNMTSPEGTSFEGVNVDLPEAGFYRMKMRSGGMLCAIKIWHGQPIDPVTLEEMDRSLGWNAIVNGQWVDIERVWPKCYRDKVSKGQYEAIVRKANWAKENAPQSALANPYRKNEPLKSPLLF